jgi:hypothetical protein
MDVRMNKIVTSFAVLFASAAAALLTMAGMYWGMCEGWPGHFYGGRSLETETVVYLPISLAAGSFISGFLVALMMPRKAPWWAKLLICPLPCIYGCFLAAEAGPASGSEIALFSIAFVASYFIVWSGAATGSHFMARIRQGGQTG